MYKSIIHKSFFIVHSILFICFFFIACSKDSNSIDSNLSPNNNSKTEESFLPTLKTIFIYMPWTDSRTSNINSLHNDFIRNLEDIENAIVENGGLKNTRLLVFIDSLAPKNAELFEIKYRGGTCYRETLRTYNTSANAFYTTTPGLTSLLQDIKALSPSPTYSMIIGSHGVGWIPTDYNTRARTRFFGGTTREYQTDISTLAQSIKNANMLMQYIMFDDCYMSTIEVAYELKDVTHYIIGCTSEIMAYGMPYDRLWNELVAISPNYKRISDLFYQFYSNYRVPSYNCGTIGITDCSKAEEMASLMKIINERYQLSASEIDNVQKLDGYNPTIFYDMGDYVNKLCQDRNLYSQFKILLNQLTPYHSHTNRIYTAMGYLANPYVNIETFSGITISDLTLSNQYNAITNKQTTSWWHATH